MCMENNRGPRQEPCGTLVSLPAAPLISENIFFFAEICLWSLFSNANIPNEKISKNLDRESIH